MPRPTLALFPALAGLPPDANYPQLDMRGGVPVLALDAAADEYVDFFGVLPANYAQRDMQLVLHWTAATATSGNVVWQVQFERHTAGTFDLDSPAFGSALTTTAATAANSGQVVRSTIALSHSAAGSPIAGDSFRVRVQRTGTSGSDTMTGDAQLLALAVVEV